MTAMVKKDSAGALSRSYGVYDIQAIVEQKAAIQACMQAVMRVDEHYGIIPGTDSKKPSLLQPGADTLCFLFRLKPEFTITETLRDDFIAIRVKCTLRHIETEKAWAEGEASANSREKKYRNQTTAKVCPKCGKPAIIKGREEYGGGWLCFAKKDGCNAKFKDDDKAIVDQSGRVQGEAVWDLYNTLIKMACKRAKVAAVLTAAAASDIFTQDLEDLTEYIPPAPKQETQPPKAQGAPAAAAAASTVQLPLTTAPTAAVSSDDEEAPDMVPVYIWKGEGSKKAGTLRGEWVQVDDEPKASHKQIALIHMLLRDLKLPEDDYRRQLLNYYGKDSSSLLSVGEASDVIEKMEKKKALAADKAQRQQQRFAREEADTEQRTLEQLQRERQAEVEDAFGVEVQG